MMSGKEITEKQKKYNLQSWSKQANIQPLAIEKADGIYLWDYDGNRYTDMSSELVNLNVGFGNKAIGDAIKAKVDQYCYVGPGYADISRATLAEKIISLLPDSFGKIFFTNAGADANENAIKIARMFTGRHKIMSRYRSYHGSTFGAGNLTGEPRRFALEPGVPGFVKFFDPYLYREKIPFASEEDSVDYYVARLEEQIQYEGRDSIAAIVMETVTGSNGVIIPPVGYMKGVRKVCDTYGILLIFDEVMAGWYRTGTCFAFENFDVVPDIVTFAKGVTCGYVPLGGVAVSSKIASYFDDHLLSCGLTYSGHPLGCAAGVACVQYYEDAGIADHVKEVGAYLAQRLDAIAQKYDCVGDVRHIGLFSSVELVKDKQTKEPLVPYGLDSEGVMPSIVAKLKAKGFMTYSHENMIFVNPPLIITRAQLKEELAKLEEVLAEL